jgi:hypothetical protein
MPDVVKGGLFVGAAVLTGILLGLLAPQLVGAERDHAKRPRTHASPPPTMPDVVGEPLDQARSELGRRGIAYTTDVPGIVERAVPELLDVCASEPAAGNRVRGSVRLHAALSGTCGI